MQIEGEEVNQDFRFFKEEAAGDKAVEQVEQKEKLEMTQVKKPEIQQASLELWVDH